MCTKLSVYTICQDDDITHQAGHLYSIRDLYSSFCLYKYSTKYTIYFDIILSFIITFLLKVNIFLKNCVVFPLYKLSKPYK